MRSEYSIVARRSLFDISQGWPSLITETIDVMIQPQRQKIRTNKFQCNDHYVFWWVDIDQRLKNKQEKDHCLRPLPHWLWSYPLIQFNFTENTRISEMMVWDALDGDFTRDLGSRVLSTDPSLAGRDLPPSSRINNLSYCCRIKVPARWIRNNL